MLLIFEYIFLFIILEMDKIILYSEYIEVYINRIFWKKELLVVVIWVI